MKPKTNRVGSIYAPSGQDRCQTPPYALGPLLPYLDPAMVIWEPAAGEGLIAAELSRLGFTNVITGDILTGQNFFHYHPDSWNVQVTNPPYRIKYQWLSRSYELGNPFALLLPVETLGAATAQYLFREYGTEIILLDQRVNFKMPEKGFSGGGAQFPTAWFTWKLNIGQQMTFARLNRSGVDKCASQPKLFEVTL